MGEKVERYKLINGTQMRLCSTCREYLPVETFSKRKASYDGLAYSCKPCERAAARKSYESKLGQEKAKERYAIKKAQEQEAKGC